MNTDQTSYISILTKKKQKKKHLNIKTLESLRFHMTKAHKLDFHDNAAHRIRS